MGRQQDVTNQNMLIDIICLSQWFMILVMMTMQHTLLSGQLLIVRLWA